MNLRVSDLKTFFIWTMIIIYFTQISAVTSHMKTTTLFSFLFFHIPIIGIEHHAGMDPVDDNTCNRNTEKLSFISKIFQKIEWNTNMYFIHHFLGIHDTNNFVSFSCPVTTYYHGNCRAYILKVHGLIPQSGGFYSNDVQLPKIHWCQISTKLHGQIVWIH